MDTLEMLGPSKALLQKYSAIFLGIYCIRWNFRGWYIHIVQCWRHAGRYAGLNDEMIMRISRESLGTFMILEDVRPSGKEMHCGWGSLIFAYAETQDLPQPPKENPLQIIQIAGDQSGVFSKGMWAKCLTCYKLVIESEEPAHLTFGGNWMWQSWWSLFLRAGT